MMKTPRVYETLKKQSELERRFEPDTNTNVWKEDGKSRYAVAIFLIHN